MGMSIEDIILELEEAKNYPVSNEAVNYALDTIHKYLLMQADYENRLKADLVAMLEEIDLQFDEICFYKKGEWKTVPEIKAEYKAVIQQKINSLKEVKDG